MTAERLLVKRQGEFHYSIVFQKHFHSLAEEILKLEKNSSRICVVTDSNVAPLYLEEVKSELAKTGMEITFFILPAGEENKNLEQIQEIYEHLILHHFDRKDMLVALGGGVTGDMTGYAAATYLRGIDFVQIPTTLLSQVDSSIGGKTGVDFKQYKNMVGAFHQPLLVYMNVSVLKTLSAEEFASGMGEVLKHGFIKDVKYSNWIYEHRQEILDKEEDICREMIYRSCVIKKTVVENDPTEKGERALLNMGHTIGHAVEKLKNFKLRHGQCVSIGCAASAYLSMEKGWISRNEYEEIKKQLLSFHLPVETDGLKTIDVLETTKSDKKMAGNQIRFILLKNWGNAVIDMSLTDEDLIRGIESIRKEGKNL